MLIVLISDTFLWKIDDRSINLKKKEYQSCLFVLFICALLVWDLQDSWCRKLASQHVGTLASVGCEILNYLPHFVAVDVENSYQSLKLCPLCLFDASCQLWFGSVACSLVTRPKDSFFWLPVVTWSHNSAWFCIFLVLDYHTTTTLHVMICDVKEYSWKMEFSWVEAFSEQPVRVLKAALQACRTLLL